MATKAIVLLSLLILQCTSGKCMESRLDNFTTLPSIPAELLALKNYGAVDFLSSPLVESIKPSILPSFPSTPSEVVCENLFTNSNPYTIGATNFEVPGISVTLPTTLGLAGLPYVIDQIALPSPVTPISLLNAPSEPLYQFEPVYEWNPYNTFFSPSPVVPNVCLEKSPVTISSLPSVEVPVFYNHAEVIPLESPCNFGVAPIEISTNSFCVPAIEVATIPQVLPNTVPSLRPAVDVLGPVFTGTKGMIEPPMFLNSVAVPTPLVELPVIERIPTYTNPIPVIQPTQAESISSTISNIRSMFSSTPTFTPNSKVRKIGGISVGELSASRSNGFLTSSALSKRPTGISVRSENTFQGPVTVSGSLPFLGAVGFSGSLPSKGYGTVNYGCSSGNVRILSEAPAMFNNFYHRP